MRGASVHHREKQLARAGMTFIELLVAIGLMVIIFGGAFVTYSTILDTLTNSELRTAAAAIINREIELARNIPYESVGTVGGIPPGILELQKVVTWKDIEFLMITTVRNIDDPFDGTLGGTPNDTSPADYKLVEVEVRCLRCAHFAPIAMTTTIAPKNIEGVGESGSLFVHALNASGEPIAGATVRVVNAAVTPTINLTDNTNTQGVLQLVGIPTSTDSYQINVSYPGYSTDRTYPVGGAGNPNPIHPHASVITGSLTDVSFLIDKLATATVQFATPRCAPVPNVPFSMSGAKLIGTDPDVIKFSTTSQANASGTKVFSGIEWDSYTVTQNAPSYHLLAPIPLQPFPVNPGASVQERLILVPAASNALSVNVRTEGLGTPVSGAYVTLAQSPSFSEVLVTGESSVAETDWSGSGYFAESGGIDTESIPGTLRLLGTPYPTSTEHWLISNTFDFGTASTSFLALSWNPTTQPPAAGADSVRFQVAANNNNATWNFVGPDGTAGTFFTSSGTQLPYALNGNRYLRYRAYLRTASESVTPSIDDVTIGFTSPCVPPASVYFGNLTVGDYDLQVTATGYALATTTASIGSGWRSLDVELTTL